MSWYQELGSEISGVVAYDTTGRHPVLIAFNRTKKCYSASIWLDGSLRDQSVSDRLQKTKVILKIDSYPGWDLSLALIETKYWLPGFWVLKQDISADILKQLREGDLLTVSFGSYKHSWSLAGSNSAIRSAYNAC